MHHYHQLLNEAHMHESFIGVHSQLSISLCFQICNPGFLSMTSLPSLLPCNHFHGVSNQRQFDCLFIWFKLTAKKNINFSHHWPFVSGSTNDRWIPCKGLVTRKASHVEGNIKILVLFLYCYGHTKYSYMHTFRELSFVVKFYPPIPAVAHG